MRIWGKDAVNRSALLGASRSNSQPDDDTSSFWLPDFSAAQDDARGSVLGSAFTISAPEPASFAPARATASSIKAESEEPAHNGSGAGTATVLASGDVRIDGLLSGIRWAGPVTYSTPDAASDYQATYFSDRDGNLLSAQDQGFSQFSLRQPYALHFALNLDVWTGWPIPDTFGFSVAGFTNLDLTYAGDGSGAGTMRFANTSDTGTAYTYGPSTADTGGDSWFGPNVRTPLPGNFSWYTMLHEAGHALGLRHGHEVGGPGNTALPTDWDSMEFSVMTQRSYVGQTLGGGYTNEEWGYAQTYMMLDIAALQYMYGADFTANSGDSIYTWEPSGFVRINNNAVLAAGSNRLFHTIWDGNGNDTYNLSNFTTDVRIDLRPGGYSVLAPYLLAYLGDGHYARGNVYNALQYQGDPRSLIENATGGTGNDSIIGNDTGNQLLGLDGNDYLEPGAGNDRLYGGDGNDILTRGGGGPLEDAYYGGNGIDTISAGIGGLDLSSLVVFDLEAGFMIVGGANYEIWSNFENYYNAGGSGEENVLGTSSDNVIETGSGDNVLEGRGGNDTLIGGGGADTMRGGTGDDRYNTDGLDTLIELAGEGYDEVFSSASITLSDHFETLYLIGGAVNGTGNAQNNAIIGNDLANTLRAGEGTFEFMNGAGGNDLLIGGAGHDEIMGGTGADTFRFENGLDAFNGATNVGDFLYDFTPGEDTIQLNAAAFGISSLTSGVNFITGPSPGVTSAVPTLLYSTTSAYLLYDPDGTGAVAPYILAVLNGVPALSASSFSFY